MVSRNIRNAISFWNRMPLSDLVHAEARRGKGERRNNLSWFDSVQSVYSGVYLRSLDPKVHGLHRVEKAGFSASSFASSRLRVLLDPGHEGPWPSRGAGDVSGAW